jgi:hypothetical protein
MRNLVDMEVDIQFIILLIIIMLGGAFIMTRTQAVQEVHRERDQIIVVRPVIKRAPFQSPRSHFRRPNRRHYLQRL